MGVTIEQAERAALDQVKFVNSILEELRKRNEALQQQLGTTYAKLVGLGTPYEKAIFIMRQVKTELDGYLAVVRAEAATILKKQLSQGGKKKHKKSRQFPSRHSSGT